MEPWSVRHGGRKDQERETKALKRSQKKRKEQKMQLTAGKNEFTNNSVSHINTHTHTDPAVSSLSSVYTELQELTPHQV